MPKVSVIVPVYNTEKYLSKCIQSLINQTLSDIEIILINDGSTDDSMNIISEFCSKYPDIIKVINKENGGQATARNAGIAVATGDYIGFMDSDDWAKPEMYELMYNKAISNDYDLVESLYRYQKEDETELKPYGYVRKYKDNKDMFLDPLVSPWNKLIKASILKKESKWFTEGCIYEDTAFFIKLIPYINKSEIVLEKLLFHIDRDGSTMNANKSRRVANIFSVAEDSIVFYKNRNLYEQYRDELEYFWVKILLCSSFIRIGKIPDMMMRKQFCNETIQFIKLHFPDYKNNKYLDRDIKGKYMKSINRLTGRLYVEIFHLKG